MASFGKHVVSDLLMISRGITFGLGKVSHKHQGVRNLYAVAALGVDNYAKTRDRVRTQFTNMSDRFRSKMNEFSEQNSTNMIFTEDLKNMVHLVEPKSNDVDLVVKMIKRFNQQNKEMRFGSFVFGPVVMRMFHFLNEPHIALEAFKSPELEGFFDQLISYQVLMDLLFKNEMYQDILEVLEIIKGKQMQDAKYPKNVIVLTFAACYKLNTPESLKYTMDLWKQLQDVGHTPLRRATTFAAGLAVNQNSPHIALEIISSVRQQNYVTVRNIKVAALADIGRPEDALPILRGVLEIDDPTQRKHTFTQEVMEKMTVSIEQSGNKDSLREFESIKKTLLDNGHITQDSLDDLLCTEITASPNLNQQGRDRRVLAATFTRQGQGQGQYRPRPSFSRPGLQDLY